MIHNILVVGCGNMGSALIRGLFREKRFRENRCCLYDIAPDRAEKLAGELNLEWVERVDEVPFTPALIILAFKPDNLPAAARSLMRWPEAFIVSMLAGVSLEDLMSVLGRSAMIFRIMPNLAVEVGEGVIPVCFAPHLKQEAKEDVLFFLSTLGWVFETEEGNLEYYTALSGSGPGFVSVFIDALVDGGVNIGIPWETSLKLALQTVYGTAALLKAKGCHPGSLKNQVASPGGSTIAGIHKMEEGGVRAAMMAAVDASYRKIGLSRGKR